MLRIATGIIAIGLLSTGGLLYLVQPEFNPMLVGMMVRIGALFGVIWLAFPQLESLKGRVPAILTAIALICVVVAAAKPSAGRVVILLVTIGVSVAGVLKWLSKIAENDPKRRSK
jgi:hypothetical protein